MAKAKLRLTKDVIIQVLDRSRRNREAASVRGPEIKKLTSGRNQKEPTYQRN